MVEALKIGVASADSGKSAESISAIQALCKQHIKGSSLPDEAFEYMARLIDEDAPRNAEELFSLISDFMTDGMVYSEDAAYKMCEVISKVLLDK